MFMNRLITEKYGLNDEIVKLTDYIFDNIDNAEIDNTEKFKQYKIPINNDWIENFYILVGTIYQEPRYSRSSVKFIKNNKYTDLPIFIPQKIWDDFYNLDLDDSFNEYIDFYIKNKNITDIEHKINDHLSRFFQEKYNFNDVLRNYLLNIFLTSVKDLYNNKTIISFINLLNNDLTFNKKLFNKFIDLYKNKEKLEIYINYLNQHYLNHGWYYEDYNYDIINKFFGNKKLEWPFSQYESDFKKLEIEYLMNNVFLNDEILSYYIKYCFEIFKKSYIKCFFTKIIGLKRIFIHEITHAYEFYKKYLKTNRINHKNQILGKDEKYEKYDNKTKFFFDILYRTNKHEENAFFTDIRYKLNHTDIKFNSINQFKNFMNKKIKEASNKLVKLIPKIIYEYIDKNNLTLPKTSDKDDIF